MRYYLKKITSLAEGFNYNINFTGIITFVFGVMIFGPYFKIYSLPLRIDHFLFPLIFFYALYIDCKELKNIKLPNALKIYIVFVFFNLLSTIAALYKGGFFLSLIPFFGLLEGHARIFIILYSMHVFLKKYTINFDKVINWLMIFSVIIALFGIFQVFNEIKWANNLAVWLSVNFYVGRFTREKTIVDLCLNIRSFATFFSPSNYSLYSMFVFFIIIYMRKFLKLKPFIFISIIFIVLLGWALSISKGFLGGIILALFFLFYRKKWRELLLLIVVLIPIWGSIKIISPYADNCYTTYIKSKNFDEFYNRYFGPRFGYLITKGKNVRVETSVLEITDSNKNQNNSGYEKSEALSFITGGKNDKKFFLKGYLDKSIEVFKKNWIYGVGYSSNVSSGDSMFVNLFITGGIIGTALFIFFLFQFLKILYIKYNLYNDYVRNLSEVWIFSSLCFFIMGLLLPTFIQDRTADIFWILGGLLAFQKNNLEKKT